MNISQPQNPISTLADLELLISQKKQLLATSDADLINLQKATIAENYTIRQLLNQKEDLENQVASLQLSANSMTIQVADLSKQITDLNAEKEILTSGNKKKSDAQLLIDEANRNTFKQLSDKEETLRIEQSKLALDLAKYATDKENLDEKVSKIQTLISEIT